MDPEPILPQPEPIIPPSITVARKFNPVFLLAVLVLLLAFGVSGVLLGKSLNTSQPSAQPTVTPVPDKTADWKTYTDQKLGFSLKYPSKLKLITKGNIVILNHNIPYENTGDCDMSGGTGRYKTLDDFNVSFEIKPKDFHAYDYDGDYNVADLRGKFTLVGAEGCGDTEYYFPINDKTLFVKKANIQALSGISTAWNIQMILSIPDVITSDESKKIFDQILSTFKFLPSASSGQADQINETAGWKTYINEQFRYSIAYPPNWEIGQDLIYYDSDDIVRISSAKSSGFIQIFPRSRYPNIDGVFAKTAIKINGTIVDKYEGPDSEANFTLMEYLIKGEGNNYFTIQAHYRREDTKTMGVLEQIVTTFRFTP